MHGPRYAIYFAPSPELPIWRFASRWLGYDAHSGERLPTAGMGAFTGHEQEELTAIPRRYGFHATLKAPFRLAAGAGKQDLLAAARALAERWTPFSAQLQVGRVANFLALIERARCNRLDELAADCVVHFDALRAPLPEDELRRRQRDGLTAGEQAHLLRWGYPYVFEHFRFHMTLTSPVPRERLAKLRQALSRLFAPHVEQPVAIDSICVFVQPAPEAPFNILSRHPFRA